MDEERDQKEAFDQQSLRKIVDEYKSILLDKNVEDVFMNILISKF